MSQYRKHMSNNSTDRQATGIVPGGLTEVCIIVAAGLNNAIGQNNRLLWHLPTDLKFFKNATWGFPVIMGRKTFEAIGKPLPGRVNIVISRGQQNTGTGIVRAGGLDQALTKAAEAGSRKAFVIGGGEIYRQALPVAKRILMTRVHASPEADTFFPEIHPDEWTLAGSETFEADEKHPYRYVFEEWLRKNSNIR